MSFIVMHDRTTKNVTAEKGLAIWRVLIGETEPENEQQSDFIAQIDRIYLNRKTAPQSYLDRYPQLPTSYKSTLGVRHV